MPGDCMYGLKIFYVMVMMAILRLIGNYLTRMSLLLLLLRLLFLLLLFLDIGWLLVAFTMVK